jgi:hypothetical protein
VRGHKLAVLSALVIGLLAGSPVAAQDEVADPMAPSAWTGTYTGTDFGGLSETTGDTYREGTGWERATVVATDARFSGQWEQVLTDRNFGGVGIKSASGRLENDGGAWVGTFQGYGGPAFDREFNVFTGEGGYDGLIAVFTWSRDGSTLEGVIVPGELPPTPDLGLIPAAE